LKLDGGCLKAETNEVLVIFEALLLLLILFSVLRCSLSFSSYGLGERAIKDNQLLTDVLDKPIAGI
jgi:hypothetical protein